MPLPVIGDVFRCAFNWSNSDSKSNAVNVMHFHGSGMDPADVATILDTHITTAMWEMENTDSKLHEIDITKLDGSSITFPFIPTPGVRYAGAQSNEDMNLVTCAIVKIATAKRGRSYRGRIYLPWVIDNAQSNGVLDATLYPTCAAAWVTFFNACVSDSLTLGVASYKLATFEPAIAVFLEHAVATQRRRNHRTSG